MILIHPPAAKPSEPPAGIARLSGALSDHGRSHIVVDANIEALLFMINGEHMRSCRPCDRWTARSLRNISINHAAVKKKQTYKNIDRYKRAVIDLDHAVEQGAVHGALPGIANYRHAYLSPLRSEDLMKAAEHPEENPYYPWFSRRLPALVEGSGSPFAGFSLNYLSQALCTFAMMGFLKRRFPGLKSVLGGGLVTSWMRNPDWRDPFKGLVDYLIAGPGEGPLLDILDAADCPRGQGARPHGTVLKSHSTPFYGQLPLDDYLSPGIVLPYSASSGCYWNKCSFCPEQAENNPYIPVPADTAMDDLDGLVTRNRPVLVHLLDNAVSAPLLKKMAARSFGVPWYGFARISRLLTDIDFCMDLKRSGCVMLKLGLESGDQGVLDRMQKGIDIETASLVLKTLKKSGIGTYVYLLFGTPHETLPAARKTLEFVVRHKDEVGFLNAALFNMPVCGPGVSQLEIRSFYEGDLSLYTAFVHPGGWSRKEVRMFLDNEFRKNRVVSAILQRDPPVFTSNHAPFFLM